KIGPRRTAAKTAKRVPQAEEAEPVAAVAEKPAFEKPAKRSPAPAAVEPEPPGEAAPPDS
ncbi:MAG TPA: hypothetical protein VNG70_11340, partial [Candidatus Limnocylindria bacterium]|nr:hypothetical protein [Candidatus Limnocylindria bacterium]